MGLSTGKLTRGLSIWLEVPHNMVAGLQKRERERKQSELGVVFFFFFLILALEVT